jgi:arylsulfatase A-like enzyme
MSRRPLVLLPLAALLAVVTSGACRKAPPVDLLRKVDPMKPTEGQVAGRDLTWIAGQTGKPVRIDDVVYKTLPASPPSKLVFPVEVPKGARLELSCGIPGDHHGKPGVEFVVKLRRNGREDVLATKLLDPLTKPEHRGWVPLDIDLAGKDGQAELVLETRGFEQDEDAKRAFWGAPAIIVPEREAPLVIVYLVDTLRADHTTPYGYQRDTTPELAKFAKDAVQFDSAIAAASWTKPSVASLLTSKLPGRHRAVQLRDPLDAEHITLQEMLEMKGWATSAAIANSVIYAAGTGFEKGFQAYAGIHGAEGRPSKLVNANVVVDRALQLLDARRGMPHLLYVHTLDPHVPYQPPPPWDQKFEPHPVPGHPAIDPRTDYLEPLDKDRLIAQYDGDVAYGDAEFGRFVKELKARGVYDRATIVFLGDHGEEFLDHGKWLHGRSVFDELIHIPLLVKFPGQREAGRRVAQQVQVVDVLPTILAEEKLPVPQPPTIAGRPLQEVLQGGAPERAAVSEISHRGFVAHGMRTGADKYIQRFSPEEDELYFDLHRDPKEQANVIEGAKQRVRLLKAGVEAVMVPNSYRHNVRVSGPGDWQLKLRTAGWIGDVASSGLGTEERAEIEGDGRKLALKLRPKAGAPREVSFTIRPMGAPVYLEGTRDGKPLLPAEVLTAEQAIKAAAVPARLPDVDPGGDSEKETLDYNVFAPPPEPKAGISLWLTLLPGRSVMDISKADREVLCALGYIPC